MGGDVGGGAQEDGVGDRGLTASRCGGILALWRKIALAIQLALDPKGF